MREGEEINDTTTINGLPRRCEAATYHSNTYLDGRVKFEKDLEQTGKLAKEIIKVSEEMNVDLLVMASSKSSSLVSRIVGSTARRVIDNIKNSVLIVRE